VGLMVYRLLTGRNLGVKRPSEVGGGVWEGWDPLVSDALEDRPRDRFRNAQEMIQALRSIGDARCGTCAQNGRERSRSERVRENRGPGIELPGKASDHFAGADSGSSVGRFKAFLLRVAGSAFFSGAVYTAIAGGFPGSAFLLASLSVLCFLVSGKIKH